MKVKSESEVTLLCPTLSDPMDCSLPGSSVPGILQARVLAWGVIASSKAFYTKNWVCCGFSADEKGHVCGCLQPGPVDPWPHISIAWASVHSYAHCQPATGCSVKGSLMWSATHVCSKVGDLRIWAPSPLPNVISSGAKTWVSFSFCVSHPRSRQEKISPWKQFLCEIWMPEMRVTETGSPPGG